ncbi:MAG: hypothetical protein M1820_005268 [Bogoriella megaspora]|nr:MAG: hypothetical protein M1820_005268 [Bogoriella megaspora]
MSVAQKKQNHPTPDEINKGVQELRKALAKGGWAPISATQKRSVKDPGVKGSVWVSRIKYDPPPEDNVKQILLNAISELGDGTEKFAIPEIGELEAQWTGFRKGVGKDDPEPALSEKEKYEALCQEISNDKVIFYAYGGAMVYNGPHVARATCGSLSRQTGSKCYTIRYRLAPQHPFPHALLDVLHGYLTLLSPPPNSFHPPIPPSNIIFAGDSAGGCLLVSLIQTILSFHRTSPSSPTPTLTFHTQRIPLPLPSALTLVSPALDWLTSLPSWSRNRPHDIFRGKMPATESYFPSCPLWPSSPPREHPYATARTLMHPLASPCTTPSEKWKGAPPMWIAVGSAEGCVDGARILARDVRRAGGWVGWREYERMPHLWAFVFKGWWQSGDVMGEWGRVCKAFGRGDGGKGRGEAMSIGVDGEARKMTWDELNALEHTEVLCVLENAAEGMEVYKGQTQPMPKSLL